MEASMSSNSTVRVNDLHHFNLFEPALVPQTASFISAIEITEVNKRNKRQRSESVVNEHGGF